MRYDTMHSPVGEILVAGDDEGLRVLHMDDEVNVDPTWERDRTAMRPVVEQLRAYFAGDLKEFDVRLAPHGTAFQQRVWKALCDIPYGATASYGDVARAVGMPGAARAVGQANGRNPIAIIVPCHRVVAYGGKIGGYAGGLDRKRLLLTLESGSDLR